MFSLVVGKERFQRSGSSACAFALEVARARELGGGPARQGQTQNRAGLSVDSANMCSRFSKGWWGRHRTNAPQWNKRQCICQRRRVGKQATTESNTGTRIRRRRQTTEAESLIAEARLFVQPVPDSTSSLEQSQENLLLLSSSEAKLKPQSSAFWYISF